MTQEKFRVHELPPEAIGAVRDLNEVDAIFKRTFYGCAPATRRDIPPPGFAARLRWARDKFFFREATL